MLAAAGLLVVPDVAGATTQTFTADGTFTVPAGVTSLALDVKGAEGGMSLVFTPEGGRSARQAHKYTIRPR
jgi:hypothetical protein